MRSLGYCNYPLKLLEPPQISHPAHLLCIIPGCALESQVGWLRATALGDWQQVVDLQQMGRGAAPPGERVAITAASSVALPDVAPDRRGNVAPPRGLVAAVNRFAGRVRRCSG